MQDYHTKALLYDIREVLKEIRDALVPARMLACAKHSATFPVGKTCPWCAAESADSLPAKEDA